MISRDVKFLEGDFSLSSKLMSIPDNDDRLCHRDTTTLTPLTLVENSNRMNTSQIEEEIPVQDEVNDASTDGIEDKQSVDGDEQISPGSSNESSGDEFQPQKQIMEVVNSHVPITRRENSIIKPNPMCMNNASFRYCYSYIFKGGAT